MTGEPWAGISSEVLRQRLLAGLGRLTPRSHREYSLTLRTFGDWVFESETAAELLGLRGEPCPWWEVVANLLPVGAQITNTTVEHFLAETYRGKAAATVAARRAAIRWAFRLARADEGK